MGEQAPKRKYFVDLDVIRFWGCLAVVIAHVNTLKLEYGFSRYTNFDKVGLLFVVMFFGLSGFLITYMLLKERDRTTTVNFKNYYARRILRIWPLYYLIVFVSILILSKVDFMQIPKSLEHIQEIGLYDYICFILILPHFADAFVPYAMQAWSIGVEEQFYLLQPFVLKYIKSYKKLFAFFLCMTIAPEVVVLPLIKLGILSKDPEVDSVVWTVRIYKTLQYSATISLGCATAVGYLHFEKFRKFVFDKRVQIINYLILGPLLLLSWKKPNMMPDIRIYSVLWSIMIVNMAFNKASILRMTNPILAKIGKLAYGIYMYHIIAIGIVINIMIKVFGMKAEGLVNDIILTVFSLIITYLLALFSYKYFETPFLKMKEKFIS